MPRVVSILTNGRRCTPDETLSDVDRVFAQLPACRESASAERSLKSSALVHLSPAHCLGPRVHDFATIPNALRARVQRTSLCRMCRVLVETRLSSKLVTFNNKNSTNNLYSLSTSRFFRPTICLHRCAQIYTLVDVEKSHGSLKHIFTTNWYSPRALRFGSKSELNPHACIPFSYAVSL